MIAYVPLVLGLLVLLVLLGVSSRRERPPESSVGHETVESEEVDVAAVTSPLLIDGIEGIAIAGALEQ